MSLIFRIFENISKLTILYLKVLNCICITYKNLEKMSNIGYPNVNN